MGSKKELLILGLLCFLDKCISDCPLGYNGENNKCVDQDECKEYPGLCGQNTKCFNTVGSYYCQCVNGFTKIRGGVNFTGVDGECQDINECNSTNRCGPGASCINTIGSYTCTCLPGYTNSSAGCVDQDECEDNPGQCGKNAKCFNTVGRYYCQCVDGFTNIGGGVNFSAVRGQCQDIDECTEAEQRGEKICGEKGSCLNKEGSYWCSCQKGFTNYDNERTPCSELDCKTFSPDSEQTQSLGGLANILSMMRNSCLALSNPTTSEGRPDGNTLLEKLLTATDVILSPDHLESSKGVSGLLGTVENSIRVIGPQLKGNSTTMNTNKTEAEITVQRGKIRPVGPIHLKNEYASLDTDWSTAAGTGSYPGFAMAALLTYKNLERSVNESFQELTGYKKDGGNASFQIFSRVVSVVVSNPSTQNLSRPINITFRHLRENTEESANVRFICVYWTEGGSWSTHGCHNLSSSSNHTVCSCKHLSSFAVLMARFDMEHTFGLQLLTKICLVISLLCLIICILTFKFCRSIQGTRTTIHLHLCICLFMADLIFLAGISQTKPVGGCRFVAALLHYFFLGVFTWMLLEGVQLYRMVVLVFNATIRPLYLYITGYGAPLVILIISAIIRPQGYGTEKHCWLSVKDGLIWSFFGPVCFIIIVNVLFFIITVWKLAQKFASLNPDLSKLHKIRAFTVTAIAQMCILGLMWVFGAFLFEEGPTAVVYIFTILNSLQGALVFIMHCLLSKQVREEYAHFLSCICTPQKKRYSDLSSTNPSSSQSQASRSGQQTGESQI